MNEQVWPLTSRRTALRLALALALPLPWPATSLAQALPEADARAVRAVVQAQLDAFAAGDAERAFSYASAGIRAQFGNAAQFMAMVRGTYPMVVRPVGVTFFAPQVLTQAAPPNTAAPAPAAAPAQLAVQLRDAAGREWLATYTLALNSAGQWRIEGCTVAPQAFNANEKSTA